MYITDVTTKCTISNTYVTFNVQFRTPTDQYCKQINMNLLPIGVIALKSI